MEDFQVNVIGVHVREPPVLVHVADVPQPPLFVRHPCNRRQRSIDSAFAEAASQIEQSGGRPVDEWRLLFDEKTGCCLDRIGRMQRRHALLAEQDVT